MNADDKRLQDQVNAANNAGAVAAPICDHYWAWVSPAGTRHSARLCMSCNAPDPKWLNEVYAADDTPRDARSEVETLAEVLCEMLTVRFDWDDYRISEFIDRVTGIVDDAGYVSPARHDADIAAAKAEAERVLLDRLGEEGGRFYDVLDREMADSLRKDREYVDAFRESERAAGAAEVWRTEWRTLLHDKIIQDSLLATAGLMETQRISPECRGNRSPEGAWDEAVCRLREIYDAQIAHDPTLTIGLSIGRAEAKTEAKDWFCRKCGMHRDEHAPGGLRDECALDPYLTTASKAWTNVEENR